MRKLLSFFVVLTSFFFFSCSSEEDIRSDGSLPFYLNVYIEDAEGHSYLNPEHERCINLDKSKVYSVLEDGSLKLHSDDDYQYNDYATDENGNPIKYRVFSKCFEIDHWPWLEGLEDYRRPSFFSLLFNKSKHNYGPRPNLFRLDAICDGFGYLSDTYGDKNVTKKWKALKKFLLAFFLIIMFAACFFFSFWIVLAVGREDPQFDKFFRWTLLIGGLFIATILAKAIWEFICFRGTLRWMRYRVKHQGESIMRG